MAITSRGTQNIFIDKAVEVLQSPSTKKVIMVAPVAYGKSICIANIVARLDAPCIILQPSKELLLQNYEKYTSYGYEASIYSASVGSKDIGKVTYATIGSIKKEEATIKKLGFKYIIIDECHLGSSSGTSISTFIKNTGIKNVLGVTATPIVLRNTMEGAMLKMMDRTKNNIFSTISHVVQIQEMIDSKYWSPLRYDIRTVDNDSLKFNSNGSDFTLASILKAYDVNNIEERCVEAVKDLRAKKRKSILIFAPSIASAVSMSSKIPRSAVVHNNISAKERKRIIDSFKMLEIDVVINVEILTTGFDHPQLDSIILARPTASIALFYQMLGRITRIHEAKRDGLIIDLSGNVSKFGMIEDLNYEYIPGYGWGLFTKDTLLTHTAMSLSKKPTKKLLKEYATAGGGMIASEHGKIRLKFGKFKDKQIQDVPLWYLSFILENFDFNSLAMKELKNSIETFLKLK